jgi:hypothetical protein
MIAVFGSTVSCVVSSPQSAVSCVVSSPQHPLNIKRKAKAENTPSGVDRQNQSQKCDMDLNAGNMAAAKNITNNTINITGSDLSIQLPPTLERRTVRSKMSAGDSLVDDLLDDDLCMLSNMFEGIDDNHLVELGLHDNAVDDHDNTDILSQMAYDVTRNLNKADNEQQWIPTEMSDPLFLNGFKISKQYSICCANGERVGGCLRPNTAEEQLIFGCGGILPRAMGLFNRMHGRYKESITKLGAMFSFVVGGGAS